MSHHIQADPCAAGVGREYRVVVMMDSMDGVLPPSDQAAATLAIERFGEAVVYCPSGDDAALRFALAAGCAGVAEAHDRVVAEICLIGQGGAGVEGDLAAAKLAASMSAMLVLDVLDVQQVGGQHRVVRDLGRGAREVLQFAGPAVLLMSNDAPVRRYVSRYRRSRVILSSMPEVRDVNAPLPWQPVRQRPKTGHLYAKTTGDAQTRMFSTFGLIQSMAAAGSKLEGDADSCAAHLIRYLAHHGFIKQRAEPIAEPAPHQSAGEVARQSNQQRVSQPHSSRAPRSLERPAGGLARRPRPYSLLAHRDRKLARGPRPVNSGRRSGIRGPYPISKLRNLTDG